MTAAAARPRVWTTDPAVIGEERRNEAAATLTRAMRPALYTLRLGKPDDLAFVVDSWVTNAFRRQRKREATTHVRALLARPTSALYVAHVPDEPDAILGWALLEPGVLHFVYVRSSARRLGVARALLSGVADKAIEYSTAAPVGVVVPKRWTLNLKRSETK